MSSWIVSLFTWRSVIILACSFAATFIIITGAHVRGYFAGKAAANRSWEATVAKAENTELKAAVAVKERQDEFRNNAPRERDAVADWVQRSGKGEF